MRVCTRVCASYCLPCAAEYLLHFAFFFLFFLFIEVELLGVLQLVVFFLHFFPFSFLVAAHMAYETQSR